MQCPECGSDMVQGARYCHRCGWDSKLAAAGKAASTSGQRPRWKRLTMSWVLGVSAVLVLWLLMIPRSEATVTLTAGQPAPAFELETLGGERLSLSDLKGRPVVLNFWATWCTPCRKEMPEFQSLHDRFGPNGLAVLGINTGESKVAVADFRDQVKVSFPLLLDPQDEAQSAYRILPLPTTFFIDRTGVIRAIYPYQMTAAQIEAETIRLMQR